MRDALIGTQYNYTNEHGAETKAAIRASSLPAVKTSLVPVASSTALRGEITCVCLV